MVHLFFSYVDKVPENLGGVSDEYREHFHQQTKVMEKSYQGCWNMHIMADYCCNLKRDALELNQSKKLKFLPPQFDLIWLKHLYLFDNAPFLRNMMIMCPLFNKGGKLKLNVFLVFKFMFYHRQNTIVIKWKF